jgi:Cytosolic domain of 10TM putative phosphate transporter/Calcium-dependent channel, 7TM region, putative phosphate
MEVESNFKVITYNDNQPVIESNFELDAKLADKAKAWNYRHSKMIIQKISDFYRKLSVCNTAIETFGNYSIGLELYFTMLKQLSMIFFLIALVSAWPLIENYYGAGLSDGDKTYPWDGLTIANQYMYIPTMSLNDANNRVSSYENPKIRLIISDLIYTLIFVFFIVFFQIASNEKVDANLDKNVTIADYSLQVTGFPCEAISDEEVKEFFNQFGDVSDVYLARKYNGLLSSYKKRAELTLNLEYYKRLKSNGEIVNKEINNVQKNILKFDKKIERNETSEYSHNDLPVIIGFITFNSLYSRSKCLKEFGLSNSCCRKYKENMKFKGFYKLKVKKTSDPSDINWENLEYSSCKRFLRKIIAILIAILILIVSIVIVYLLKSFDGNLPDDDTCLIQQKINTSLPLSQAKATYTTNTQEYCYCKFIGFYTILSNSDLRSYCTYYVEKRTYVTILKILASFSITFINFALKVAFRFLSRFEKVKSRSEQAVSIMRKVFIASFINTSLIVLVLNVDFSGLGIIGYIPENGKFTDLTRAWYTKVGSTITMTMVISTVFSSMTNLLVFYPLGACKRKFNRMCCCKKYKTQKEINLAFKGPDFDIVTRYSQVLNITFTSLLYSSGIPLLNVTCFFTFFVLYWVDKFLILRHYSKPHRLSQELNNSFKSLLPYAAVFHCGFSIWIVGTNDIFPVKFYESNGYLYSYYNDVYDRVISVSGAINLGIIVVSVLVYVYVNSSNLLFSCKLDEKDTKIYPENHKSKSNDLIEVLEHIKQHGLGTYNILSNPDYRELVLALNAAAETMKKTKKMQTQRPDQESHDFLVDNT